MSSRIVFTMLLTLISHTSAVPAQDDSHAKDLSKIYQKVVDSVVYVEVGNPFKRTGSGSGVVLHADGYIATAAHVVDQADVIRVTFHDDSFCMATIVTMARSQDLALLKIEKLPEGVRPATLGMAFKVAAGQPVFCIGAPYDLRFSITSGVVSAVREDLGTIDLAWKNPTRMIQTDTAINPGNSGGPIFNDDGEVIGIAVSTLRDASGIGLAVPVDLIRRYLVDEAVPFGGVVYLRVTPEFASLMNWRPKEALIVERVQLGSLAEESGLRGGRIQAEFKGLTVMLGGDVIYLIGGHPVSDYEHVREYLRALTEKDEIRMTVLREGQMVELHAPFKILAPIPSIVLPTANAPLEADPVKLPQKADWFLRKDR